jgi:hypothetical protein
MLMAFMENSSPILGSAIFMAAPRKGLTTDVIITISKRVFLLNPAGFFFWFMN